MAGVEEAGVRLFGPRFADQFRKVCKDMCLLTESPDAATLVGIGINAEKRQIATLWSHCPGSERLAGLGKRLGDRKMAEPRATGFFRVRSSFAKVGDDVKPGVEESIGRCAPVAGHYGGSEKYLGASGRLAGLFADPAGGLPIAITAGHVLWGAKEAVWTGGMKWRIGSDIECSPRGRPFVGKVCADAAKVKIDEKGLLPQKSAVVTKTGFVRRCDSAIFGTPLSERYCVMVKYDDGCEILHDQEIVDTQSFATDRDSGSLVFDDQGEEFGLVVAVSDQDSATAVSPWANVLTALRLNGPLIRLT